MRVEVAYVGTGMEAIVALDVMPGTSVAEAVAQSGLLERIDAPRESVAYAIFGVRAEPAARVADGDRIEITRPLRCDPKVARRQRAKRGDRT